MKNCHLIPYLSKIMLTFFYEDGSVEVFSRDFSREVMKINSEALLQREIVKAFQVLLCERKVAVLVADNATDFLHGVAGMMNEIVHRA